MEDKKKTKMKKNKIKGVKLVLENIPKLCISFKILEKIITFLIKQAVRQWNIEMKNNICF